MGLGGGGVDVGWGRGECPMVHEELVNSSFSAFPSYISGLHHFG